MKILILQARLSSSRLPGKALLPFGLGDFQGKSLLECVMLNLKTIKADIHVLACDEGSVGKFASIGERCGFNVFAGSLEDVLDRFCSCIRYFHCENAIVIRATGDNPFIFTDAANFLLEKFDEAHYDYATLEGLPLGSGLEVFKAASLLKAETMTELPYDREHVCPSLYNHPENFSVQKISAPKELQGSCLKTTVDTMADYRRARRIFEILSSRGEKFPFPSEKIIEAAEIVNNQIIFFPNTTKGEGTGHVCRCVDLALKTGGMVFIKEEDGKNPLYQPILSKLEKWQLTSDLPEMGEFSLIVTDLLHSDEKLFAAISPTAPLVAIEEATTLNDFADFAIDVLPSADDCRVVNLTKPEFIPQPKNRKISPADILEKAIVCIGGEDPAGLTQPFCEKLVELIPDVTGVLQKDFFVPGCTTVKRLENLKEHLWEYDLVVTHYGFTAFEALAAGCKVILVATTPLHEKLAIKYGFVIARTSDDLGKLLKEAKNGKIALRSNLPDFSQEDFAEFLVKLAKKSRSYCPHCGPEAFSPCKDKVSTRTENETFRLCAVCGREYQSF
ncbi:MAG: hypothetical protein IIW10_00895 [Spirochaetaceae bacterium]|nr:hypothetical protein [Spirochaetaceae bacterium]